MDGYAITGFDASTPWLAPLAPFILSVGRAALGVEGSARTVFFHSKLAYAAISCSSQEHEIVSMDQFGFVDIAEPCLDLVARRAQNAARLCRAVVH